MVTAVVVPDEVAALVAALVPAAVVPLEDAAAPLDEAAAVVADGVADDVDAVVVAAEVRVVAVFVAVGVVVVVVTTVVVPSSSFLRTVVRWTATSTPELDVGEVVPMAPRV